LARFQTTGSLTSSALFDLLNQEGGFNKAMQETIYVGLDLGSSQCQQTVLSGVGVRRFSHVIATSEQRLRSAFDKLEGDVPICVQTKRPRHEKRRGLSFRFGSLLNEGD